MVKKVVIMRGLPGSGKTKYAVEHYPDATLIAADDYAYHHITGSYKNKPAEAHTQARIAFGRALVRGDQVIVVDNTNTRAWEYSDYEFWAKNFGYEVEIVEMDGNRDLGQNRTPRSVAEGMRRRWERDPRAILIK